MSILMFGFPGNRKKVKDHDDVEGEQIKMSVLMFESPGNLQKVVDQNVVG